jgi:hypothetical protein
MKRTIHTAILLLALAACGKEERTLPPLGNDQAAILPSPGDSATTETTLPEGNTVSMANDGPGEIITGVIDPSAPAGGQPTQTATPAAPSGDMVSSGFNKKP